MRQKPLKSGFLSPAALNRGTMDDKRSGRSCRHLLVTQTLPLGQTFYPSNPFKTSFLFPPLPPGYTYIHDFPMLGRSPVRRDLASKPELFVPQLLGRGWHMPSWSTTMNAPHILTSLAPQKRPKSDGQHGIHVTTSPESGLSSRKYLDSHFSVRPKFRPIAAAGGAWTEQCPRPRQ